MDNDMNESLYGDVIPQEDSAGSAAEETAAENDGQAEGAPSGAAEEGTGNTPQKDTQKPEQSLQERARQAEGRRLREREQQGFNAGYSRARAEMDELLKKIGIENPATGGTVNSVDALADYYKGMRDQRMAAGQGTAQDMKDVVLEAIQEERAKNAPTSGSGEVERQIAEIRAMDPEMTDLGAVLRSEAGPAFRAYVAKGFNFVDAYTLAAKERLNRISGNRERARQSGKDHLSATNTRGKGAVTVPPSVMAQFRALVPGATDEEIRKFYAADQKRLGK